MKPTKVPTLAEIENRIHAHLKRFERDPVINKRGKRAGMMLLPYFLPNAYTFGRFVRVMYVMYQGAVSLSKAEALAYLRWLDAGNVGTHYQMERSSNR